MSKVLIKKRKIIEIFDDEYNPSQKNELSDNEEELSDNENELSDDEDELSDDENGEEVDEKDNNENKDKDIKIGNDKIHNVYNTNMNKIKENIKQKELELNENKKTMEDIVKFVEEDFDMEENYFMVFIYCRYKKT
jgi:hypothetical protein